MRTHLDDPLRELTQLIASLAREEAEERAAEYHRVLHFAGDAWDGWDDR